MEQDWIGSWSETKLNILKEYAKAYSKIMSNQDWCKGYIYIDAFAGAGIHKSKSTGEDILGSPLNALNVTPPFTEYHFIDIDKERADLYKDIRPNVHYYHGDCNEVLKQILPSFKYSSFKRVLCICDPYGLQLNWEIIELSAKLTTVDIFINFPIMDINRNVLRSKLQKATPKKIKAMNALWGGEDWKSFLFIKTKNLFGDEEDILLENYKTLAIEFKEKLKTAGFNYVPEPILMKNSIGGPLYYLFFASYKKAARNIIKDIFTKYWK